MIGGLSIPYVTIPTNNSTGITIGGTKYFMVILLLENRFGLVNSATLQSAEDYCRRRQDKTGEQHHSEKVFRNSRIDRRPTKRGRMFVHWQEPRQTPRNSHVACF